MRAWLVAFFLLAIVARPEFVTALEAEGSSAIVIENKPLLTDDDLIGLSEEQIIQTIEGKLLESAKSDDSFSLPHESCRSGLFQCGGACERIFPLFPQIWPAHRGKCNKQSGSCGRTLLLGCECFYTKFETIPCPEGILEGTRKSLSSTYVSQTAMR